MLQLIMMLPGSFWARRIAHLAAHIFAKVHTRLRKIKLLTRCQLKEQLLARAWTPSALCPPLYVETLLVVFVSHWQEKVSVV